MAKLVGAWCVCIDFTDLNKAILKKPCPLPWINQLVNSIAGHELLSFLDAYKRYLQISMTKEDMPKIAFVTDNGIYCYTRMPFGLKNVVADFQKRMNKAFERLTRKIVEVYVDDIIFKSKKKNLLQIT